MSVGVILYEMPESCRMCELAQTEAKVPPYCGKATGPFGGWEKIDMKSTERPDWCPLKEVEPVRHGHWVEKNGEQVCSNCNWIGDPLKMFGKIMWSYCPYCGAKMEVEV